MPSEQPHRTVYYCASCDRVLGDGTNLNPIWARHKRQCRGGPATVQGVVSEALGPRCGKALRANDRSCGRSPHNGGPCRPAS